MDRIWTRVVGLGVVAFLAATVLTQDSSRALFLISGPEVLHSGTPTSLGVTILADFPVKVTAELGDGDTVVAQTEDFDGGSTRVLTLPPIPDSKSQDSHLNLVVRGYRGGDVIFTKTTALGFQRRNVSTFIQTDKSRYRPGDSVRVRVVSVKLDNRPYKGRVAFTVQDPGGSVVNSWESAGTPGVVLREFDLSQTAPPGQWKIKTTVHDGTDEKLFTVEHHDPPEFQMMVKTPSRALVGKNIVGSVRAHYLSGQPVHGTLTVTVTLAPDMETAATSDKLTQTKEIYGSMQFHFTSDEMKTLHASSSGHLHITASVSSNFNGFKASKTVEVHLLQNAYQLMFRDVPSSLKPSLDFSAKLRIWRYDREPLSAQDLNHSAVVEVDQRKSPTDTETTFLTLTVPEDGNVHITFRLQDQVETLFIRAKYQSIEETLTVHSNYVSPTGSYIQITPTTPIPAQIGSSLHIDVESTIMPMPSVLHFVVSSGGQVVAAGTASGSFSLTPELSWSPEACVTVYCVLASGEVARDTAHIPINQHNYVSLSWSSDKAHPGEQVSLTVSMLEAKSHVGIVVMEMHDDDIPEDDQGLEAKQECQMWMLTNAPQYEQMQSDASQNGNVLLVEKYWSNRMEVADTLLWLDDYVSGTTWTIDTVTVPDGVPALGALALAMSDTLGLGFTAAPIKLAVSKDFSLSLKAPQFLIRGEEVVLEVIITNHLDRDLAAIVLLAESDDFEFVLGDKAGVSVVNAQKLTLGSHESASALFPIRPTALGEIEIPVDAICAESSDSLIWTLLVKPEGVEQSYSQTLFLELEPDKSKSSRSISFSFPPDVVPGSQKGNVVVVGDILALSFSNLDSLVQLPLGCGEQNMVHFAASVYILLYLEKSTLDDKEIRSMALDYIRYGYQRQLSYQLDDGSFSAFGASDKSGSVWLTAFVLRCFNQAQSYTAIDYNVMTRVMTWLWSHQGTQGEFTEVGRLIHTEMQGGQDGPAALTAYVLIALLENESYMELNRTRVRLARGYLEKRVSSGVASNYTLCLMAYALALANSPVATTVLSQLSHRADFSGGATIWGKADGLNSQHWQPRSAQIEMVSYVLLALFRQANLVEGIPFMKWLSKQRGHLGGYGTTQDTVVALQALAYYAAFSGANAINAKLKLSDPASSFVSLFGINSTTYRIYQSQEIDADRDINLNISMEGRGFAIFQMNVFYNVKSTALSAGGGASDEEAFSLHIDVTDKPDHNHLQLSMCTRLKDSQLIPTTGMAILDVGMLSGFRLSSDNVAQTDLIRKIEVRPAKIILYLDSINKTEVCIRLHLIREYKVARVQNALVRVYDYYEPRRQAAKTYKSDYHHNIDSCVFCGPNCERCRPGIIITSFPKPPSRSVTSATYSWRCIFLGVAVFLINIIRYE